MHRQTAMSFRPAVVAATNPSQHGNRPGRSGPGLFLQIGALTEPLPPRPEGVEMTNEQAHGGTITLLVTMTFRPEKGQEFLDFAASIVEKVGENEAGTLPTS